MNERRAGGMLTLAAELTATTSTDAISLERHDSSMRDHSRAREAVLFGRQVADVKAGREEKKRPARAGLSRCVSSRSGDLPLQGQRVAAQARVHALDHAVDHRVRDPLLPRNALHEQVDALDPDGTGS